MLVCIAGIDGSGKSTLVENLQKALAQKYRCTRLRLYDTVIRSRLQKKAGSYLRHHKIENKRHNMMVSYLMNEIAEESYPNLMSALKTQDIVIVDRYLETIDFIVENYQVDKRTLAPIIKEMPSPDVYIYLRVSPAAAYARITKVRKPGEGEELHEITAAANYYDLHAARLGLKIVDGEKSQEEVFESCMAIINAALS